MQVGTADAHGRHPHLHLSRTGIWNRALDDPELAHSGQFRGARRNTHRLRNRRMSSASAGTQATALPPLIVRTPLKSKNCAPASSMMILGAARSQGFTMLSIHTSASPRATIMASRQPPKHRTDQNGLIHDSSSPENEYLWNALMPVRQRTASEIDWIFEMWMGMSLQK